MLRLRAGCESVVVPLISVLNAPKPDRIWPIFRSAKKISINKNFLLKTSLKPNTHSLTDLSRDFTAHLSNHRCRLTQLRCIQTSTSNLAGSIDLTDVDGPIRIKFFLIVLFHTAPRLRCAALIAGNSFTGSCINTRYLLTGLLVDGLVHLVLILLGGIDHAVGNRFLILNHIPAVLCRCIGGNVAMRIDRRDFRPTYYAS